MDIDAYRIGGWPPLDEDVEAAFGHLHELKNEIFFGSLTEAAMREFE